MSLNDNIQGYWKLDESVVNNGTTPIVDSSGNSRTGTATADSDKSDASGKLGRCVTFNGGDFIDCGVNPITGTAAFSMQAWIKTTQVAQFSGAISIGASGTNQSAYIGTTNAAIGGGFYGTNYSSDITSLNTWHHVVMTFAGGAGGAIKIYVDNVLKINTTATPALTSADILIGRIGSDTIYDFSGSIDEVGLWSRELSAAEVTSLYNNGNALAYPFAVAPSAPGNLGQHVTVGNGMSRNERAS